MPPGRSGRASDLSDEEDGGRAGWNNDVEHEGVGAARTAQAAATGVRSQCHRAAWGMAAGVTLGVAAQRLILATLSDSDLDQFLRPPCPHCEQTRLPSLSSLSSPYFLPVLALAISLCAALGALVYGPPSTHAAVITAHQRRSQLRCERSRLPGHRSSCCNYCCRGSNGCCSLCCNGCNGCIYRCCGCLGRFLAAALPVVAAGAATAFGVLLGLVTGPAARLGPLPRPPAGPSITIAAPWTWAANHHVEDDSFANRSGSPEVLKRWMRRRTWKDASGGFGGDPWLEESFQALRDGRGVIIEATFLTSLPPNREAWVRVCPPWTGHSRLYTDAGSPGSFPRSYDHSKLRPGNVRPSPGSVALEEVAKGRRLWVFPSRAVGVVEALEEGPKGEDCLDITLHRRMDADDEKGLQEGLYEKESDLLRLTFVLQGEQLALARASREFPKFGCKFLVPRLFPKLSFALSTNVNFTYRVAVAFFDLR
mmetsp:Transcript_46812/g.124487  ORF Transcript_46812/g.124487 Transcript_46812/m.124487 type:complete len:480 (-) Transcript_46812:30-1469(-)